MTWDKFPPLPSEILRQAILDAGIPLLHFENGIGVHRKCVRRFLAGSGIGSSTFDALCIECGLTLVPAGQAQQKPAAADAEDWVLSLPADMPELPDLEDIDFSL